MKSATTLLMSLVVLGAVVGLGGCSNNSNPIAPFQPEVINHADAFQFQITHAKNVTTALNYSWVNSGTRATINHSTSTTSGTASVTLFDAAAQQVYTSPLLASGTQQSAVGVSGTWTVRIVFNNYSGSANFRVEKL